MRAVEDKLKTTPMVGHCYCLVQTLNWSIFKQIKPSKVNKPVNKSKTHLVYEASDVHGAESDAGKYERR